MDVLGGTGFPVVVEMRSLARLPAHMRPVCHRLSQLAPLSNTGLQLLDRLERHRKEHQADTVLAREGVSANNTARFLLSGWACRQRIMADGRRQIFGFLIPGDILGAPSRILTLALASTVALTRVTTVDVPLAEHSDLPAVMASLLAKLVIVAERETQMLLHDHVTRLGHMSGLERMAHLLLELQRRLIAVDLAQGQRFPLPLRQEVLADALGLSSVHINRTLQQLRREGLIIYVAGEVTVLDPDRLASLADGTASRRHQA